MPVSYSIFMRVGARSIQEEAPIHLKVFAPETAGPSVSEYLPANHSRPFASRPFHEPVVATRKVLQNHTRRLSLLSVTGTKLFPIDPKVEMCLFLSLPEWAARTT